MNAVHLTRDLSYARIYWNRVAAESDPVAVKRAERAFETARGFLRKHLGKTLSLRIVPQLEFRYDEALERGRRIDALIGELEIPAETAPGTDVPDESDE